MSKTSMTKELFFYDLTKIAEPFNGTINPTSKFDKTLYQRMAAYLNDLRYQGVVDAFQLTSQRLGNQIVYFVKVDHDAGTTELKVPVEVFTYPWTSGGKNSTVVKPKRRK